MLCIVLAKVTPRCGVVTRQKRGFTRDPRVTVVPGWVVRQTIQQRSLRVNLITDDSSVLSATDTHPPTTIN